VEEVLYLYKRSSVFQTQSIKTYEFSVGDFSLSKHALYSDYTYVTFTMDPVIKQWEEYVYKSYYDWISAIGGLLSLVLFAFFRISVFMTDYFATHEWNMGLLSMMSPIFRNRGSE